MALERKKKKKKKKQKKKNENNNNNINKAEMQSKEYGTSTQRKKKEKTAFCHKSVYWKIFARVSQFLSNSLCLSFISAISFSILIRFFM